MAEDERKDGMEIDECKKNEVLFLQMVLSLQTAAWIHLGKIPDHTSGKFERDMYLASAEIDMLMMLKEKTKGNLSEVEKNTLSQIVQQLQVNYLNELEKDKKGPADKKVEEKEQIKQEEKKETETTAGDTKKDEGKEDKKTDKKKGKAEKAE